MNYNIEIANNTYFDKLLKLDKHINEKELLNKLDLGQIYIIMNESEFCGWLRYGLFWDNTPFMNMLFILENYRANGLGTFAVKFWEEQMRMQEYSMVMTSTQSNENAQHFYRKLGYKDAGSLLLENEPLEIIFTKNI